jgi:glutamate/tyrosine decarboxylase-like PLP-dependent enzyme
MSSANTERVYMGKPQPLPPEGVSRDRLRDELERVQVDDAKWRDGRVFGIYFPTRPDIDEVAAEAHSTLYRLSTHHPEVFPSLERLERDVVAMAAQLFGAEEAIGNVTSGGTESIVLALKAARDRARTERGIAAPEAIVPRTAYPAFAKAGDLLGVKVVRIPVDAQFKADLRALRDALTRNTVFVGASVPTISHGVIDPVAEMAAIAHPEGIHFHVDASLGGFQLPFLKKLGHRVPEFDFRVPGVTSLSADLHKYAYTPMGASVLLYCDAGAYAYQPFTVGDWVGKSYRTPGLLGSRSGGSIAAAWAVMRYLGERGYLDLTRMLWDATQRLAEGINRIPGLQLVATPTTGVLVFGSATLDIARLAQQMESKGWSGRPQADPPSIRLLLAPYHRQIVDAFLQDLASAAASTRTGAIAMPATAA